MTSVSSAFLAVAIGAVLQNVIFARGFGTDAGFLSNKGYLEIILFDGITSFVAVLTASLAWTARHFLASYEVWRYIRWPTYFLCLVVAYLALRFVVFRDKNNIKAKDKAESVMARMSFNGVAFGIALLAATGYRSFIMMLAYTIGCCIGMMGAHMLIHAGAERIELCLVPKAFAGVPILMIYIGILSLAVYGLVGHQLPT